MTTFTRTLPSPLGPLTAVATEHGLCGLYTEGHRHGPGPQVRRGWSGAEPERFDALAVQLDAFFAAERRGFALALAPVGTPFQQRVWSALRAVPHGTTVTYGELARRVGAPAAVRAVGAANGRNPLSIVVPCHRVVGAGGALTGYAGGLERKRALLALEAGVTSLLAA